LLHLAGLRLAPSDGPAGSEGYPSWDHTDGAKEMNEVTFGEWGAHPEIVKALTFPTSPQAVWKKVLTKHEGAVLYFKLWNFWARAGAKADLRSDLFFRDYEQSNANTDRLLGDIGFPSVKAETEVEIWNRIGVVWTWLRNNVQVNDAEYATISSVSGSWPSVLDYARYYAAHGLLVWSACFTKAHLFATLLGRMVYPRYRFAIAEAHHAEGEYAPTAAHNYVAAYVAEHWFYLDPMAVYDAAFPDFEHRRSVGMASFRTVDYECPFGVIPLPLSGLLNVPHLPH